MGEHNQYGRSIAQRLVTLLQVKASFAESAELSSEQQTWLRDEILKCVGYPPEGESVYDTR